MAEKVGLKETEYTALVSQIKEIHAASLKGIETALTKVEALNCSGGGFYVKELTPKVAAVVQEIQKISAMMEIVYSTHEEIIDSFRIAIENYDVCS